MNPRLLELLHQQRASGYPDVAGAHASATVPVSDRLVTAIINGHLPPSAPVRELDLRAHDGNRLTARVRLSRPALMPPISVTFAIDRQPELPQHPVLVLRVLSLGGLVAFAGVAARFLNVLPPGLAMNGDQITVDLRTLLEQRGMGEVLLYLEHLQVLTEEGKFVISVRGGVPRVRDSSEQP